MMLPSSDSPKGGNFDLYPSFTLSVAVDEKNVYEHIVLLIFVFFFIFIFLSSVLGTR